VPSLAASRAAFVIVTYVLKMKPNWMIPSRMKNSGMRMSENSTRL
jgi:hypothetical protein